MSEIKNCAVCKHKKIAEINRDLRADPMASEWYSKVYKIPAFVLLEHARKCLSAPLLLHAEALERHAEKLAEIGERLLTSGTIEPAMLGAARSNLATAADLRKQALSVRGVDFTHIDLQRSPAFRAFLTMTISLLSEPRFRADDHAALRAFLAMMQTAEGDPGAASGGA